MNISLALLAGLALFLSMSKGGAEGLPESPQMELVQPSVPLTARNRPLPQKRISWIDYSLYSGVIATHAADWASMSNVCVPARNRKGQALLVCAMKGFCLPAWLRAKWAWGLTRRLPQGWRSIRNTFSQSIITSVSRASPNSPISVLRRMW